MVRTLFVSAMIAVLCCYSVGVPKPSLKFKPNKTFKIVQFSDIQDDQNLDPRTSSAMARILDSEKPDLVVLTGDTVSTGGLTKIEDLKSAIQQLSKPMEDRRIPWVTVLGNHDTDGLSKLKITKAEMFELYRAYPYNISPVDPKGVTGSGNALLKVLGSSGKAAFGVWLIDSNAYVKKEYSGQTLDSYDWIRSSQVAWYLEQSKLAESELGAKLPGIMFFHICLPEYAQLAATKKYTGERNEPECPSTINSGLFAAILDRGDVLGTYVGHDHANTYEGLWYGVRLGYGGSIGYGTYGVDSNVESEKQRIRGARVFVINEANPKEYTSKYVYANDVK